MIDVDVTAAEDVPRREVDAARRHLSTLDRWTDEQVGGAVLTLRRIGRHAGRQWVADAHVLVDGRTLAAHTAGRSPEDAAEAAAARLGRQLRRIAETDVALRNDPREITRALSFVELEEGDRPGVNVKPPEERQIVHRHPYLSVTLPTLDAIDELLDVDAEFYLFTHARTNEDVVVYRRDDGRIGLLHPPGSVLADETDIVVPKPSKYDEPITLAQARAEMDLVNHRFLYFIDSDDGRGKVIYLRHDGDYGLVHPL